jgi:aminoglycoside 6-adenylyltransferase
MRTEKEMLDLILDTARQDERVRAVILNGSRANPHAARDVFQDYDVIYLVTEVASFKEHPGWIRCFGELMILQLPDDMDDPLPGEKDSYAYLMQFMDGNRIDLSLLPLSRLGELGKDSLSILLLDKDGNVPPFAPASESGYLPKAPTAKQFADCCNEFWWVCTYVAKGLWRQEIIYARYMLDEIVREQLMKMLTWYIGVNTNFQVTAGKYGKTFEQTLPEEMWKQLLETFADGSYEKSWQALFSMVSLFGRIAQAVAKEFGYKYPRGEAARVTTHLEHVRNLPPDATEMY